MARTARPGTTKVYPEFQVKKLDSVPGFQRFEYRDLRRSRIEIVRVRLHSHPGKAVEATVINERTDTVHRVAADGFCDCEGAFRGYFCYHQRVLKGVVEVNSKTVKQAVRRSERRI